jgi:hypothetical protein
MSVPVQTLIAHVLVNGLSVYAPSEPIRQSDAQTVLDAINLVLDDWNAETQASYAETFTVYVTTGVNPQTIGPTGTWVTPARPVSIDGLAWDTGNGAYRPLFLSNDPQWWNAQQVNAGAFSGAFYSADEPNGLVYFNNTPPSVGTNIRLMQRTTLGPVVQTGVMVLPPGYQSALEFTVMERVVDAFHATLTPNQIQQAGNARARIWANNLHVGTLSARGQGLPGTHRGLVAVVSGRTLFP